MPEKEEKKTDPVKYFICGGFGGICTVLSGHPLDTIKVRLQTMPAVGPGEKPMYKGTFDCAKQTVKNEGFKGLYKGMSAPLTGIAPMFAISFFSFGLGQRLQQNTGDVKLTYTQQFLAGSFSAFFTTVIAAPGERVKCLLQVQQGNKNAPKLYNGMIDCARKLLKEGGIRSLYKGSAATLLRDIPASGTYFFTYEVLMDVIRKNSTTDVGLPAAIFSGGMSGVTYWLVGMPADVLKSRLQTAPAGTYTGIRAVFAEMMKNESVVALYKGLTPVMLRAFPANAACFFGFELCMRFLNKFMPDN